MSQALPTGNFKWSKTYKTDVAKGYILEVDLEYPKELHESHNSYPLAPEKLKVPYEWMSPFQKSLATPDVTAEKHTQPSKQGEICPSLQKPAAVLWPWNAGNQSSSSARVWPKPVDGTIYKDELLAEKEGANRFWKGFVQTNEQFCLW